MKNRDEMVGEFGAAEVVGGRGILTRGRLCLGALAVTAASALATPPTLDSIDLPIDASSIASAVAAAGAAILLIVFPVIVGFAFVWKVLMRSKEAV